MGQKNKKNRASTRDILIRVFAVLMAGMFLLIIILSITACGTKEPIQPDVTESPTPAITSPLPETTPAAQTPAPSSALPVSPIAARNLYEAVLTLDVRNNKLKGQMRVTYVNTSPLAQYNAVFRLHANDIQLGCLQIESVALNEKEAFYTYMNGEAQSILRIPLDTELQYGESAEVFITFTLNIPETGARFGENETGIMLGNFLPIAAVYDENGEYSEASYIERGDAFFSETANYKVRITIPTGYQLAYTGTLIDSSTTDGQDIYYIAAEAVREFALAVLNSDMKLAAINAKETNTLVTAFASTQSGADFAAQAAADALDYYSLLIGYYPYPNLMVVPFDQVGGMEYPGLVMIYSRYYRTSEHAMGALVIAHEVAHQWFYNVVGSNQILSPWLDESLVEYLGFKYYEFAYGSEAMQTLWQQRFNTFETYERTLRLDQPLADYEGNDYFYVVYAYGAHFYRALNEKIGESAFEEALRIYYNKNSFSIATKEDLISAFNEATGEDMTEWFESNILS